MDPALARHRCGVDGAQKVQRRDLRVEAVEGLWVPGLGGPVWTADSLLSVPVGVWPWN